MRRLPAITLIVLVLASCAKQATVSPGVSAAEDPALQYGSCDQGGADYAPATDFVASVERWLQVVSLSPDMSSDETLAGSKTVVIDMQVQPYDSETGAGQAETRPVAIHNSMLPGIVWAFETGGAAFLALGSKDLEREMVLYSLVRSPGGQYFFAGECQYLALTAPLRGQLGDGFDSAMDQILGETDAAIILAQIAPSPSPQPVQPTILNPQDTSSDILDALTLVTFAIDVPPTWSGPYTVCTKITEGWNDCFDLASPISGVAQVEGYVGPDRLVEVWLLDEGANLLDPIELLGTVDLSVLDKGLLSAESGSVVRLAITGQIAKSSPGTPVSDPEVKLLDPGSSSRPRRPDLCKGSRRMGWNPTCPITRPPMISVSRRAEG